jgi:hypothetical protein
MNPGDKAFCDPAQEARHVDGVGGGEKAWTPGPWRFAEVHKFGLYPNDGSVVILAGDQAEPQSVATVAAHADFKRGQGHSLTDDPARDANAHLIAAAPALYEALAELRTAIVDGLCNSGTPAYDGPDRLHSAIDAAAAALSQARGEQP